MFQLDIEGLNNQFPPPRTESYDHRLAVLPFRNLNANEDQNYLGEGIAEELILALGKVKGLRVVARSTSFALKDTNLKPQEVGKRLGVEAVLVGEVVVGEQDLKIEVELIDVESGVNMWHGHYITS